MTPAKLLVGHILIVLAIVQARLWLTTQWIPATLGYRHHLVNPEGALERRSHWENTSHPLLVGAILHLLHILYAEEEKTFGRGATFLSDPRVGGQREDGLAINARCACATGQKNFLENIIC